MVLKKISVISLATAGLFAAAATFAAQPTTGPATMPVTPAKTSTAAPAPAIEPHTLAAQDVETFYDGLVPYALARGDMAGGVIAVVKDGKILFSKGYGYSDVAKRAPVIADRTLFRPGSVSKPFTWTAVMQLVQAGKIDLDRDVNDYIDFKIPEKFGKPITMRNLMTHTPGFEDGISGAFVQKTSELIPLRDYVINHIPARIYPPGKVVAYSNYGATLAGYIVQRLSGEPYADYIENHIFKPLEMEHSTFVQPLPSSFAPDMSKGYIQASDDKPRPFELIETAPAGALTSTGTDMAHFMIAQLENGSYDGHSILNPATVALMHSPQSHMAPGLNGFDLGFYQENRNGLRIIGHAGDTGPFHSDLHLLLDKDIGIFMSYNSLGKEGEAEKVRTEVFRAFLDRYFPYTPPEEKTVADPKPDAARVAGWYEGSRKIVSALQLIFALSQYDVTARPDGTIEISVLRDLSGTPKRWREVGPLDYREVGGQTHTKFVTDASGRVLYWISDDFIPVETFQRVDGLEQMSMLKLAGGAFVATLLLTIAIWVGGAITRRHFRMKLEMTPQQARLRLASRLGVLALLAVPVGWLAFVVASSSLEGEIGHFMAILYCIGVIGIIGAVAILAEAASRILRGPGGWLVRAGEVLLGLSAIYGLWAIFNYGLANFSFTY